MSKDMIKGIILGVIVTGVFMFMLTVNKGDAEANTEVESRDSYYCGIEMNRMEDYDYTLTDEDIVRLYFIDNRLDGSYEIKDSGDDEFISYNRIVDNEIVSSGLIRREFYNNKYTMGN